MKYCEEFAALLDPYVDGELSREETARVRIHLERCPGCQSYVDGALAIRAAFPEAEETVVPEGFAAGVMAAIRAVENIENAKTGPEKGKSVLWKKILLPLAACFAIVLAVRYGPVQGGGIGAASDNAAPADMERAASSGGREGVCAADAEAPYDIVCAAPQTDADLFQAEGGLEAAPAPQTVLDEPAAPVDGVSNESAPEAGGREKTVMTAASGERQSVPRAIRLTAEQAGELLADLPYITGEDGARCYQLPGGDFDDLLSALAERNVVPLEEEALETGYLPEGYDLVYVTEE